MKNFSLKYLTTLAIALLIGSIVKGQNHQWTKTFGVSSETLNSKAIAIDHIGNVFTVGTFTGTVDFNPGVGINSLTATGLKDAYISKLDATGKFLWVRSIGGDASAGDIVNANSVTTDLLGNVIIVGNFQGIIDINTDAGSVNTLTSVGSLPIVGGAGSSDAFILKLNGTGSYMWSQDIGSAGGEFANAVVTDNLGNIYTAGSFGSTVDFDASLVTNIVTSLGGSDIYILKLSSAGAFTFVKTMGGIGSEVGNAITLDGGGNIYTTGSFTLTADFDPSIGSALLTSNGNGDIFVSKLNSAGNYVWAKAFGSNVTNVADQGNAIFVDEVGNVYTTGLFRGINAANPIDFNPGPGVDNITIIGASDIFISKLDASGSYVWAKAIGSTTNDIGNSISSDADGNIYVLGSFSGNADFDPDVNVDNFILPTALITGGNSTDLFLVKFDATGLFLDVKTIGSNGTDVGNGLLIDGANNIFLTGVFSGTADFDPSLSIANFSPTGITDAFITKWNQCTNAGSLPSTVFATSKVKPMAAVNISTAYAASNCEVISKVIPNGISPIAGNTTAKVWLETVQPNLPNAKFVKRHYEITPATNASTATGKITLYFKQQEFDDFNAVSAMDLPTSSSDAAGIANLMIEKRAGTSNNDTGLPSSYTGSVTNINPIDADIIWNEGTNRWEVSFATTGFSGFFLKTQTSLLPINWLNVNGTINKQNLATISWKVQEINVIKYEVEKSEDGYNFNQFASIPANGNGTFEYNIEDKVENENIVYYRIKEIDADGTFSYSSIIKLLPYNAREISVYPNPVTHFATISVAGNMLNKKATITDINGKKLLSITILNTTFKIDMAAYPSGIYFLKVENGKTTKIIRQ